MSPRAAWRLEALGFEQVYDYVAGEADWGAAGLPLEGRVASEPTIGSVAHPDVPTCSPSDRVGDIRERVAAAGWSTCVVVNDANIVLGRLYRKELEGDPAATAADVMRPGPSTYRPDVPVRQMAAHMDERGLKSAPVTTSEGRLLGLVRREDLDLDGGESRE